MSPLARMMAIADIFEALTAVGSPVQEGQDPVGGVGDHGEDARRPAHRPGVAVCAAACTTTTRSALRAEQVDAVRIEDYL
jgi:hypothetical protein